MGHSNCAAVTAAIGAAKKSSVSEYLTPLLHIVSDIAGVVNNDVGSCDEINNGVISNTKHNVKVLKSKSSPLFESLASKKLTIVGAVYNTKTGKVTVADQ